ncbi:hypothetical protein Acr_28g0000180 [Actinidia rufa]|uniref:Uncharacterized protein n=1 Tax=Actinidia rufa TaxID=165716 RepID=A0A7J0H878_9ERIC|nr:hypothetical protein Acr_28g0000180 [Actinidia rufa]
MVRSSFIDPFEGAITPVITPEARFAFLTSSSNLANISSGGMSVRILELKWFNKLPAGSIKSFYQLFELFVARFVINTKASKGVRSLLTLRVGKNKSLQNYSKRYWENYNEIECSEELVVVSYIARTDPGREAMGRHDAQPSNRSPRPHVSGGDVCLVGG